jgi:hypothetical protein
MLRKRSQTRVCALWRSEKGIETNDARALRVAGSCALCQEGRAA